MNARVRLALCFVLALTPVAVSLPRVAQAQGQDDADTKAARARFQEGVEAFDKGNFESARAAFKQAYALKRHPAVLLNLAQSSLKSGHFLEAAQYFQQYVSDPQGDKKDDARKGLADARAKLGRLDVSAPPGTEVTVDTNVVGKSPLGDPVDVEAGNHSVRAKLPDGTTTEQKIVVTAGQVLPVRFSPAATVVTPPTNPNLPPTNLENPPTNPNPPPNPPVNPPPPMYPPPAGGETVHPVGGLVLMIAGGALVVGGAVLAGTFAGLKDSANNNYVTVQNEIISAEMKDGISPQTCNPPPSSKYASACSTLSSNRDAVNQDATVANFGVGMIVVGALLAAGGAIWYLAAVTHKHKDAGAPAASFTPWVGPGLAGGALQLAF